MPDALSVSLTQLTGMFVQAIFFGVLMVTFGFCLNSLFTYRGRMKRSREVNWLMVSFTTLSFVLAVFDLCLAFYLNLEVFVFLQGKVDPAKAFSSTSSWISITKSALIHIQVLLGDSMLIYRCWIVWNRSFKAILLSLTLWLAAISITVWFVYLEVSIKNHLVISSKLLTPAITTFWAITITLNIITTALLVYCIWRVELSNKSVRSGRSDDPSSLAKVVRYVIESGLLYTVSSIITFIAVVTGSNGPYIMGNADIMIVPIAFNLIIIRTSKIGGGHSESATFASSSGSGTFALHPVNAISRTRDTSLSTDTKEGGVGGVRVVMTQNSLVDYKLDKESA